jgi:hypothetical protein
MPSTIQAHNIKTVFDLLDIFIKSNSIPVDEAIKLKYKLSNPEYKNSVGSILTILNPSGLLQGTGAIDRFNYIMHNYNKADLAHAICLLNKNGLLSGGQAQANLDMILTHPELTQMARAIETLDATQSLTQNSLDIIKIVEQPTPANAAKLIAYHNVFSKHLPPSGVAGIALSYLMPEQETHPGVHQFASMIGLFGNKNSISDLLPAEQQVTHVASNT